VVLLVDSKVGATELDVQALNYLVGFGTDVLIAATKIDRVPRSKRSRSLGDIRQALGLQAEVELVPVSATTGEGSGELWKRIESRLARAERPT
jgi:GTP-binding protein